MRIMVTGGAGFIGSAVVRHLISSTDWHVLNVDKLTYAANLESLNSVDGHPHYQFAQADICDSGRIGALFSQFDPDAVMHLAAESHVDRSIEGPAAFIQTNIVGTFTLLEAARRHFDGLSSSRRKDFRFHHISTDEVYGSLDANGFFTEDTNYAPNSPYSASKASSDHLVRAWHHTFDLPVVTSNCSNNYGPFQLPEKLIPVVILAAHEGRPIPVYGKGENIRDWLFVEDHVTALTAILTRGKPGQTYNVGGNNNELRNIDLVRMICGYMDELQPDSPHRPHKNLITYVTDRPGHDQRYAIDATKIKKELEWEPAVTVAEGIRSTVKWYLENRWWWGGLRNRGLEDRRIGLVEQALRPAAS